MGGGFCEWENQKLYADSAVQPRELGGCRTVVSALGLRAEGRPFMAVSKLRSEVMEG